MEPEEHSNAIETRWREDAWKYAAMKLLLDPVERLPDDATTADLRRMASESSGHWPAL